LSRLQWDTNRLGWHESEMHDVWKKHGERVIPGLFSKGFDNKKEKSAANTNAVTVLVPLCGKSVDMAHLAASPAVAQVVGVDGIRKALETFAAEQPQLQIVPVSDNNEDSKYQRLTGTKIELLHGDFFDLDSEATGGRFDVIFDRASLIAIDPSLRKDYVRLIGSLLRPGGKILLVVLTKDDDDSGPPFSVPESAVRDLYEGQPWVERVTLLENRGETTRNAGTDTTSLYFLIQAKNDSILL